MYADTTATMAWAISLLAGGVDGPMDRKRLLDELELLTHSARVRRMVELGRSVPRDPALQACIDSLANGDAYERGLALMTCFGSRDGARVLRALADPSRTLRGLALTLLAQVSSDQDVEQA